MKSCFLLSRGAVAIGIVMTVPGLVAGQTAAETAAK